MTTSSPATHAEVTVNLRQSAALGDTRLAGQKRHSLTHVPGSVLRGALAAAWIERFGPPDGDRRAEFVELFEGGLSYGPLFAGAGPTPVSFLVHQKPGACTARWDRAMGDAPGDTCTRCGEPLEGGKGELSRGAELRRDMHVRLGDNETAADGQLFSREVVDHRRTPRFEGLVAGPSELLEKVVDLDDVTIGGRRSTSGAAKLSWKVLDAPHTLVDRGRDDQDIVLGLASPAVLVDELGRPCARPAAWERDEIGALLGCEVEVVGAWTRPGAVGGWHVASGLPKSTEQVVEAGSTYVMRCDARPGDDRLRALSLRGLGLRRHEGFGALCTRPTEIK